MNNPGFTDAFRFVHQLYKFDETTTEEKDILARALIVMAKKQQSSGGYVTQGINVIIKDLEKAQSELI